MDQVKKTSPGTAKCGELAKGYHAYKDALKRFKAMHNSEEGHIPNWDHVYIYKIYCKDPEVNDILHKTHYGCPQDNRET